MNPTSANQDIDSLSYEQAFAELEGIVADLEANQKPLDDAIAQYERGQLLAAHCAAILDRAELRIRQVSSGGLALNLSEGREED